MSQISNITDEHSLASTNSINDIPKKYDCTHCNRNFVSRYNLERHIQKFHRVESENTTSDSTEDESDKSSLNEEMSVSNRSSDAEMSDDESSSEDENSSDDEKAEDQYATVMFRKILAEVIIEHEDELEPLIEDSMEKNMSGKEATKYAICHSDVAKKTLRRKFITHIINMREERRHPLVKAIMKKTKELMDDGFGEYEAVTSAVGYRKHALYNLVNFI